MEKKMSKIIEKISNFWGVEIVSLDFSEADMCKPPYWYGVLYESEELAENSQYKGGQHPNGRAVHSHIGNGVVLIDCATLKPQDMSWEEWIEENPPTQDCLVYAVYVHCGNTICNYGVYFRGKLYHGNTTSGTGAHPDGWSGWSPSLDLSLEQALELPRWELGCCQR